MSKTELLQETPSQTAGPYVHIGCVPNFCGVTDVFPEDLGSAALSADVEGERVTIQGCVWDGANAPMTDVMIEFWQADADGRYTGDAEADQSFSGLGRVTADAKSGEWSYHTIKPGPVPFGDGQVQAPHITVWIVARGINLGLFTRLYFSDEDNSGDPVLQGIGDQVRAHTLIAKRGEDGAYRFDIRLQGDQETVFFDV